MSIKLGKYLLPTKGPTKEASDEAEERVMRARMGHLEILASALPKGFDPLDYELVEDWSGKSEIRWYYRRRESFKDFPIL